MHNKNNEYVIEFVEMLDKDRERFYLEKFAAVAGDFGYDEYYYYVK